MPTRVCRVQQLKAENAALRAALERERDDAAAFYSYVCSSSQPEIAVHRGAAQERRERLERTLTHPAGAELLAAVREAAAVLGRFADEGNWTLIDLNGEHAAAWTATEQQDEPAEEAREARATLARWAP